MYIKICKNIEIINKNSGRGEGDEGCIAPAVALRSYPPHSPHARSYPPNPPCTFIPPPCSFVRPTLLLYLLVLISTPLPPPPHTRLYPSCAPGSLFMLASPSFVPLAPHWCSFTRANPLALVLAPIHLHPFAPASSVLAHGCTVSVDEEEEEEEEESP